MKWTDWPRKLAALSMIVAVSGCYAPSPEQPAEDPAWLTKQRESNLAYAREELSSLMPICLASLESGKPIDAATMAKLGYKKAMLGSVFERRHPAPPVLSGLPVRTNTTSISGDGMTCGLYLSGFRGGREAVQVISDSLEARGFAQTDGLFTKGELRVQLVGMMKYVDAAYGESNISINLYRR